MVSHSRCWEMGCCLSTSSGWHQLHVSLTFHCNPWIKDLIHIGAFSSKQEINCWQGRLKGNRKIFIFFINLSIFKHFSFIFFIILSISKHVSWKPHSNCLAPLISLPANQFMTILKTSQFLLHFGHQSKNRVVYLTSQFSVDSEDPAIDLFD